MAPPPELKQLAERVASMAEDLSHEALVTLGIEPPPPQPKWRTLAAGAVAGLVVDVSLYPIDTIKSRLQSKQGFIRAGGLKNLYRGLPPVLAGSVPNGKSALSSNKHTHTHAHAQQFDNQLDPNQNNIAHSTSSYNAAAVFFITYESVKNKLHEYRPLGPKGGAHALSHILAASLGEVASCAVRVPYEIVKMRSQTADTASRVTNVAILRSIIAREGYLGLYRGFSSTVVRDLPFSALQYPIWEKLKARHLRERGRAATVYESAYYGSIAGGIAAFLTTPLDVAKTRIMLAERTEAMASGKVLETARLIRSERGVRGLFAGVVPRVIWISVGAAIFLGSYEQTIKLLSPS